MSNMYNVRTVPKYVQIIALATWLICETINMIKQDKVNNM